MEFNGEVYTGNSESQHFMPPLFEASKKIMVFDYDDLIMLHKRGYKNGARTGQMKDRYHNQARPVVEHAIKFFDRVVFWSATNKGILTNMDCYPFNHAHLRIYGAQPFGNEGRLVKRLELLTSNLINLVAIEDKPTDIDENGLPFVGFTPRERTIEVDAHEDFFRCYKAGFKILR